MYNIIETSFIINCIQLKKVHFKGGKKMQKFMDILEAKLMPIGIKLGNNRYLKAINKSFMIILPLTIFGSIFTLISSFPVTAWTNWLNETGLATWLGLPSKLTIDLISLYTVVSLGYVFTKEEGFDGFAGGLTALVSFIIVTPLLQITTKQDSIITAIGFDWLGARGLFVAMIIGCLSSLLFIFFNKKGWIIKMPEGVPPAISSSFDAIMPLFVCVITFYAISLFIQNVSGELLPSMIMTLLAPAISGLDSLLGICLITIIAQTFWFFGLHGASITQPIRLPFMQMYLVANITAFTAGEPIAHFFTQPFWSYVITLGGGGATLGLCILLLRSKSVELKTLGKLSIGPAIFNINEPIIFGLPMVLNPLMMIPFIFVPVINSIIAYACMAFQIVGKGVIETPWTTPAPLGAALGCMDFRAAIMVIGLIVLDMCLYYPFFKLLEKQKLSEESGVQTTEN